MFNRILSSICISAISMIVLNLFFALIRLPGKVMSNRGGLRRLLRISYEVYAAVLYKLQPLAFNYLRLDILQKTPRTILTSLLSYGIVLTGFFVFRLALPRWLAILALLHGVFIGLTWEKIVTPEDFQLGERVDE
jgi:energy-converting hydrogenase Eha subunit G